MTQFENTTESHKGKHLSYDERVLIAYLKNVKTLSNRAIAKELGRAPQTIHTEIKDGTVTTIKQRQKQGDKQYEYYQTDYSAQAGQTAYDTARINSGRPHKWIESTAFLDFIDDQILNYHQSPDSIIGSAKTQNLFPDNLIPCTKTLYNWIDQGFLETQNLDLPLKLNRQTKTAKNKKNKTVLGNSIENRPDIVKAREEFGHWEIDTVVGLKTGQDNVLLTLTERKTRFEIIQKIDGKNAAAVTAGIAQLLKQCDFFFSDIFKTITSDNGVEFANLSSCLNGITEVFFTHPYSSWERGTNERHNGMIHRFIPKGTEMRTVSRLHIKRVENWMNQLPRKILGYQTPRQAFQAEAAKLLAA